MGGLLIQKLLIPIFQILTGREHENEIALIDKKNNSVKYGLDSLTTIIGYSIPVFRPLFNTKLFQSLMRRLYFFVSYNRKAIAPGPIFEGRNTCTPEINYAYRWAYIIFAWLVTSFILVFYSRLAVPLVPASNFIREFIVCGGRIVFQGFIVGVTKKPDRCDSTISVM